jgi:hypothetical protein
MVDLMEDTPRGHVWVPPAVLPLLLQLLTANALRYAVMRGNRLRYRKANLRDCRFCRTLDEVEDLPVIVSKPTTKLACFANASRALSCRCTQKANCEAKLSRQTRKEGPHAGRPAHEQASFRKRRGLPRPYDAVGGRRDKAGPVPGSRAA